MPALVIPNCAAYDGTRFSTTCKQCQPGMFVQNNLCVVRANAAISGCQAYSAEADACQVCNAGFVLTTDALACLPAIANCATHDNSAGSTALTCLACKEGFAPAANACAAGTIANCAVYTSATVCARCANGFYLSAGGCVQSKSVPFCATFDQTTPDTCSSCANHAFLLTVARVCLPLQRVPNCATYADYRTCTACAPGYTLQNNACALIPLAENCLAKGSAGECTLCIDGFYLQAGTCQRHLRFLTKNCLTIAGSGVQASFGCEACSNYYRSFDFAGQAVCVSEAELGQRPIDRCVAYDVNSTGPTSALLCRRCAEGFVLANNRASCLRGCGPSETNQPNVPVILETQDGYDTIGPMCGVSNNGDVASYYRIDGVNFIYNCTASAITYHGADVRPLEFSADGKLSKLFSLGVYRQQVLCDLPPTSTAGLFNLRDQQDPNCGSWRKVVDKYYCQRCAMGRAGTPRVDASNPGAPVQYVTCETPVQGCDPQVFVGGLERLFLGGTRLSQLFSCHKCYRNDEVPVAFVSDVGVAVPYAKAANPPSSVTGVDSPVVECLNPSAYSLGIPPQTYLATLPELCGFVVVLTNRVKRFVDLLDAAASVRCVACRPGSRPVREGDVIKACVPIANCDPVSGVEAVDSCTACKPAFGFKVRALAPGTEFEVDRTACERQRDHNCRFEDEAGCLMCNAGYTLNYDGVCEKIVPAYCQENFYSTSHAAMRARLDTFRERDFLRQLVLLNPVGCRKCTSSFHAATLVAPAAQTFVSCSYSPYTLEGNFKIGTVYTANCKNYGDTLCQACESGYVMSVDRAHCVAQDAYPFCNAVDTAALRCAACRAGYVLVRGQCERPAIPFCLQYNSDVTSRQVCARCEARYRLVQNACIPGDVANCDLFDVLGACVTCVRGYVLARLKATQYCMPLSQSLNCAAASALATGTPPVLSCTECQPDYGLHVPESRGQICLSLASIDNCEAYDNTNDLSSSLFRCARCKPDYFVHESGQCLPRTRVTKNCAVNKADGDYCAECNPEYMLSAAKNCVPSPSGILNCAEYSSHTTCKSCVPGTLLRDNACVLPDVAT